MVTSVDSFLRVSKVAITYSFSRIDPYTLFKASNNLSSNSLNLTTYSPYNFISLILSASVSGVSLFMKVFKHWFSKEDLVTVKLIKVTLEHKSGVKVALESLVIMNIWKLGEKSISWSPTLIKTLPPVL